MRGAQLSPSSPDNIQLPTAVVPAVGSGEQVTCFQAIYKPSAWVGKGIMQWFPASWTHRVAFPASVMVPSQAELAVSQHRSSVPWHCTLVLSPAPPSPSPCPPSVVSVCCFPAKPTCAETCPFFPQSPLSHGIDVSRAPAVKQGRLRLGRRCQAEDRACLPGQVSNTPCRAGTGTLHQPICCTWTPEPA